MVVKQYLGDWFLNAGIIGFLKILEKYDLYKDVKVKDNYIEIDIEILKNFHKYYFLYFKDIYDISLKIKGSLDSSYYKIKKILDNEVEEKNKKEHTENLKRELKYIKKILKTQMDKIKKYYLELYNDISIEYDKLDNIKTKEDLEELNNIFNKLKEYFSNEEMNEKLTSNLFKNILSTGYFGQVSLFNVSLNKLTYLEQQECMYKDYISDIIETAFLNEILEDKYTLDKISNYLVSKQDDKLISKEVNSIYKKIYKSFIQKSKSLEELREYLKSEVLNKCHLCDSKYTMTSDYTEGNFVPLAMSSDKARNFFWNQNVKFPLCSVCKLMFLCIPAGVTSITKIKRENDNGNYVYKEKQVMSFINFDASIEQLLYANKNLAYQSRLDKTLHEPYSNVIGNIIEENKTMMNYQAQNIFVIEFDAVYREYSKLEYFNINKHILDFFNKYANITIKNIGDYKLKLQIIDYILKNKDTSKIINDRLRENITTLNSFTGFNCFMATKARFLLNVLKKGEQSMIEEKNNKKLDVLFNAGIEIREQLKKKNEENKLTGFSFKLLNSIKVGNKKEFMDTVIRLHVFMNKSVSPIFLETMKEENLDFNSVGHSFVAGLVSDKYIKKQEDTTNNENLEVKGE